MTSSDITFIRRHSRMLPPAIGLGGIAESYKALRKGIDNSEMKNGHMGLGLQQDFVKRNRAQQLDRNSTT